MSVSRSDAGRYRRFVQGERIPPDWKPAMKEAANEAALLLVLAQFTPVGFSFAPVGPGDLLALPLRPLVSRCDRFRRPGKPSGPPLFAPSLNVQGDDTHNNSGFSVI
jgi:hypothetical protein